MSPDGRFGVTAARSGEVRLWELAAGRLFAAVGGLHGDAVDGAVFTGDSRRLVTTGDRAARWTVTGESLEWRLLGWDDDVRMRSLVLGPGERSVMVAGDGDIRWWNLDD